LIAAALPAAAQNATWNLNGTGDFNAAANWTPATVPSGTAFFGTSNQNNVSLSVGAITTIGGLTFNAGASNYIFTFTSAGPILELTGAGIVINGGSVTFANNGGILFQNASTAGSASFTNNSVVAFRDNSTAGSATITNNDRVTFTDNSTAGSATINNNGTLKFFLGTSGGTARLINGAAGIIDISPLQAVSAGIATGSIEGGGAIFLSSKFLKVGGNNLSTTFAGVLQDGGLLGGTRGSLIKEGSGTLTLSGTNTYTGATTVDGGALIVNGSNVTSSLTTVNAGGTLAGTGTGGNTQINSGGIFAPGSGSPGTAMTVAGNLAFQSGAIYLVQLSPATASFANVTGAATLAGTVLAPGSYAARSYDILHAAGGLGGTTFSGVALGNPNFNAGLSYSATDVFLNLTAALGGGTPLNQNQQNVAGAINGFFNGGGTLPANFTNVFGLTGSNLTNALTQLSGEAATGAQQGAFQLMTQFLGVMLDPFVDGRSGVGGAGGPALGFAPDRPDLPPEIALAYAKVMKTPLYKAPPAAYEPRWSVWGAGYGGYNKTSGDPAVVGSHDLTSRAAGYASGLDYHFTRDTVVGFALAGGGTKWDLAQGLGGGRSDAFQAGAYAATRSGPAYLAASLAFANYWMSTDRVAAFGDHLIADFNAQSFAGRAEAGYRFGSPVIGITPYAAAQAQSFRAPGYSEVDVSGGGFGLTYNSRTGTDVRSELGSRFDYVTALSRDAVLTWRGRLAWSRDWVSDPALTAVFQTLPGASFIVNGATSAKSSALASAGAELRFANGVSLLAKFDGEFAGHSNTYAGTGTVRWTW